MNNVEDQVENTEGHEGFIKTPKQLIVTVILAFIVPVVIIFLLISLVVSSNQPGAGSDAQTREAIAQRIKPVADFALVDASAPTSARTGQQVYESTCAACHNAGVAGAPKIGDTAAWAPHIKEGLEEIFNVALNGKGAMPAKGGNPSLSDLEVKRAAVYLANQSGASFEEPAEEEGAASAEAPAAQADAAPTAAAGAPANVAAAASSPAAQSGTPPAQQAAEPAPAAPAAQQADSGSAAGATAAAAQQAAEGAQQQAAASAGEAIDPAGEQLYKSVCFACHATGVAGAPKVGDKAAWAPLIAEGLEHMVEVAIHGKGAMPPRGGSQASDAEVRAAVQYMVQASQ